MSAGAAHPRSEASQTLDRGIRVLELLAARSDSAGLTVTELATALGVGRPVVYRLVTTLEAHHLVARADDGRVRLALGISRLASAVTPIVRAEARPVLRELADAVGATAHLTIAEGDEALARVVVEPSWTDFHVAYRSGARHRLDQGAAGRAILAGRSGSTDLVASDGELQAGAHGLAVPIVSASALPVAAVPGAAGQVDATGGVAAVNGPVVEASVGVVSLQPLDAALIGPRLERAARALAAVLR
ncbi:MAG TPA: helix-turn-helix domain-containing protein [Humibacillus sp.]|nr:helix-turn-helix domain-containing protein [Humibacillus sp.]